MNDVKINVQVRIRCDTKHGELNDAFYFPVTEFFATDGRRKLSEATIDLLIDERVAKYEAAVDAAKARPPDPPPTDEEVFSAVTSSMSEAELVKFKDWLNR